MREGDRTTAIKAGAAMVEGRRGIRANVVRVVEYRNRELVHVSRASLNRARAEIGRRAILNHGESKPCECTRGYNLVGRAQEENSM